MKSLAIVWLGALLLAAPVYGAGGDPDDVEEIEELDDIEVVTPEAVTDSPGFLRIAGRMHPALVHLPIGWLLLLWLIDVGAWRTKKESWKSWGYLLLAGTMLVFIPAAIAGFLRAGEMNPQGELLKLLHVHRGLMLATAGLCLTALVFRALRRNRLEGAYQLIYLLILTTAVVTVTLGGHFGGKLTHGPDFLPF